MGVNLLYPGHPVAPDKVMSLDDNVGEILNICRQLHLTLADKGTVPFASFLPSLIYLDEMVPAERELGILSDQTHFVGKSGGRGTVDVLGIHGHKISSGMKGEIGMAAELGIPIKCFNPYLDEDLTAATAGALGALGAEPGKFTEGARKYAAGSSTVYVVHFVEDTPPAGTREATRQMAGVCREIHTASESRMPLAPELATRMYLDYSDPVEKGLGEALIREYFERGMVDEVGVFGGRGPWGKSASLPISLAVKGGVPVVCYSDPLKGEVEALVEAASAYDSG